MKEKRISVVIPTLNEAGNVANLLRRLAAAFEAQSLSGEIIFVDDHSTDGTVAAATRWAQEHPDGFAIRVFLKQGTAGKAHSLIEGFGYATAPTVAMLDADLEYPPEAIPAMLEKLEAGADIVVAERVHEGRGFLRTLLSRAFRFFFSHLLHGLRCDSQAGLKVFRKKILSEVTLDPAPWTFDLEFLLSARNYGYGIESVQVPFTKRVSGTSKLRPLAAIRQIGWSALRLKWQGRTPLLLRPENEPVSMVGAGVAHNRQRFLTHTTLHPRSSALDTFLPWQKWSAFALLFSVAIGLWMDPVLTLTLVIGFLSILYFGDSLFSLYLVLKSLNRPPEIQSSPEELESLEESGLPLYSVLCPLYKEAHMLPGFLGAIGKLDWPQDKLEVLLLLEENDQETIAAARAMTLPPYVRTIIVPHSLPKTKPKACNYGLAFTRGEYVVIYDAEDIPEPAQLKKAYLGFRKAGPNVRCLQAKLNYFNPHQNLLTRLFTAEYSLWFDVVLPGLQSINTSIPLGGTSNHFRTADLRELEGWDPFNVTEDCDLGVRLFKRGYQTAIIDSVTLEEANSRVRNWLRQRSRWIKGYMQTYLVHMRHPKAFLKEHGWHALVFQIVVGGKIGFMFINPFLWLATILYFSFRAEIGPAIEALFPPLVFYFAVTSLVFGNFLYLYYYMIGAAKRGHYGVIKYVFLIPLYWVLVSTAALIALYQLIVKPHYWEKTAHGLHHKREVESAMPRQRVPDALAGLPWAHKLKVMMLGIADLQAPQFFGGLLPERTRAYLHVPRMIEAFVFSGKGFFMGALVLSSLFNFAFNAFLGRTLSFAELGLVIFVNTLWYTLTIFVASFSTTVDHRVSYLLARWGRGAMWSFFQQNLRYALLVAALAALFWLAGAPLVADFFRLDDLLVLIFFTPAIVFGLLSFAFQGFLRGNLRFFWAATLLVVEAGSKLSLAALFVFSGRSELVYLSIPLSFVLSAALGAGVIWQMRAAFPPEEQRGTAKPAQAAFPLGFFFSSMAASLSTIVFLSLDVLLVKHFFPAEQAGQYALLSVIGKMVYFLGSLPMAYMITLVSRQEGLRQSARPVLGTIFLAVTGLTGIGTVALGVFGGTTAPLLFGTKALAIVGWLPLYTMSIMLFSLSGVIVMYHLALRHYSFSFASLGVSLLMVAAVWLNHDEFSDIIEIVFGTSLLSLGLFGIMHFFASSLPFVARGLRDFWSVFAPGLPETDPSVRTGKRILVLNWRDTAHAFAGGAEVYIHEIAKTWVAQGHHVTLFSGNDGTQARYETIDGIDIVRRGGFYLVYAWAFLYYVCRFRGCYDIVVDCQNGIPFFSPLYVRKPVFCLMHHVHQDVFFRSLPRPLAWLASTLEKDLMPLVYRRTRFITVSRSSQEEMEALGIGGAGITIVHPGIVAAQFTESFTQKTDQPTVLYLGRLKAYKSVDVLIRAFQKVAATHPDARLIIAGSGDEEAELRKLARETRLPEERIRFMGAVSHEEKVRLLQSSWMLVNPSFMEGWGIVVIEANACGTPVIASDVPGLRDSVRDGEAGYLVPYGDAEAFANAMQAVIRDRELRERFGSNGKAWAQGFDWQESGERFFAAICASEALLDPAVFETERT